jgi:LemA protein
MRFLKTLFAFAAAALLLTGCGVQSIPQAKNDVEAKTANLTNEYKRRADLVPQLIGVVKGNSKHESETLEAVVTARSKATSISIDPSKSTPEQVKAYQSAQGELGQALGKLLSITENYPNLKANDAYRDLQSQLEGNENRIKIARQDLIESIQNFNNQVSVFPTSLTNSWFFHYQKLAQWDVTAEEKAANEKAPEVKF